jgi:hypothetical protein
MNSGKVSFSGEEISKAFGNIKKSKLYNKYQVYERKGKDIIIMEEFRRKSSAKKWIKEQK